MFGLVAQQARGESVLEPAPSAAATTASSVATPPFETSGASALEPTTTAATASAPGSTLRADDQLVAGIAYRLSLAGARYCPQRYPLTGMLLHHLAEYAPVQRGLMTASFPLGDGPGVLSVLDGSPAARAGLAAGDVILDVNGQPFPSPVAIAAQPDQTVWRRQLEKTESQLERELEQGAVTLTVLRQGARHRLTLTSLAGCPGRVRLARSDQVNGFVSGRYIVMTTGMLGFTRDEDELAIILAHELAHLVLRHSERLRAQDGGRGSARARIRATEEEADRLGLKLAWAAGYDVSKAIPFWRRFYRKFDDGLALFRTHPSIGARERLIAEAIAELGSPSNQGAERPELGEGALGKR